MKISKYGTRYNRSGIVLKMVRKDRDMSQEQLAGKLQLAGLDITQKAISRIESGERVVADFELEYLADALNISIYQLLGIEPWVSVRI